MSSPNCRYYSRPGGCTRANCTFRHVDGGSSTPFSSHSPVRGRGRGASQRGGGPRSVGPRAPNGICDFYYNKGFCSRGSECKFLHEHPSQGVQQSPSSSIDNISAFLTPAALARIQGAGTDGFFASPPAEMKPSEVNYHLHKFLEDKYRFRFAADVYGFVALMSNASSGNTSWSPEDGQLFLSTVGSDNGLLRLGDILSWADVSVRPSSRTSLSFSRGYVPLLRYLSSDYVVKSITSKTVNSLYSLMMEHFERFSDVIQSCMEEALNTYQSFKEPGQGELMGSSVISCIAQVLFEYITRFKNAVATHPSLRELVGRLHEWTQAWIDGISSESTMFDDPITKSSNQTRQFIIERLHALVDRLVAIVDRKHRDHERSKQPAPSAVSPRGASLSNEGVLAALHNSYVGPGVHRPEGPRHDNDSADIADIQIAPTHNELTCGLQPFLPANMYGAPHHLPAESMEQLLDVQFRLLREELTASLRTSAQAILSDMREKSAKTQLNELLRKQGGKYRGHAIGQDSVLFNVYTNAEFLTITPSQRGITVGISVDTPPGRARAPQAKFRAAFWESMSSKRLMQGGLVALVWKRADATEVYLGTIASSLKDLTESAKQKAERIDVRLSFFSSEVELRILQELRTPMRERRGTKLLIEATVMFESVRPFLEALRVEPENVPFARYLVHRPPEFFRTLYISPPAYATLPDYSFQLKSLFPDEAGVQDLKLVATDANSIEIAREVLKRCSRLDPSQADAMVDALSREVGLIQGPPGTGKSYTGVEILRILIENNAGPILMIAFTNHALDHMLRSVLDAKITQKIVRLGSRSADERIAEFSMENVENVAGRSRLTSAFSKYRRALRSVEEEINEFMKDFFKTDVDTDDIVRFLSIQSPVLLESIFDEPPQWIRAIHSIFAEQEGWHVAGPGGKNRQELDDTLYGFWLRGGDIGFLHDTYFAMRYRQNNPPQPSQTHATNRYDLLQSEAVEEPQADAEQSLHDNAAAATDLAGVEGKGLTDDSDDSSLDNDAISNDDDMDDVFVLVDASPEEEWLNAMTLDPEEHLGAPEQQQAESVATAVPPQTTPSSTPEDPVVLTQSPQPPQSDGLRPDDFKDLRHFFFACGCDDIPPIPVTNRSIEDLLDEEDAWSMSAAERQKLHKTWADEVRISSQETQTQEFKRLREKHERAAQDHLEAQAEIRKQLLRNVDIIGCTTTGAAKLTTLLKGIGPKILLVEEAGQVLEAHVLGSLVPSIQHMILIGDPLQLRPTLNNYALSVDHHHGKLVYKFDMSLIERLSSSGLPMSQINVQRRMRPEIADLVRMTLYPRLEDHDLVKNYPNVQGMAKDVFFFSHDHKENGGEDDFVSKYNQFEVDMIKDLVLYLLRQGPYSAEGDIVVLCAYLGQLSRLRDALSNEVAVVLDERDQAELDDRNAEAEDVTQTSTTFERVKVSRRVLLRTIDNFQGEEAKIVILSLVRNSGGSDEDEEVHGPNSKGRVNIGFLRSENRTNVALSRAREGMYILGNAANLSTRSKMWRDVIEELRKRDAIGTAFPVACKRHPDTVESISKPGQLPRIAPDGGCLLQCDTRLKCGHLCPYKCHSDDPRHVSVSCDRRCTRLCPRGHPCKKQCAESCGQCLTQVTNVELPCGHTVSQVFCHQLDNLADVFCSASVTRSLPGCEHTAQMRCSDNPRRHPCRATCAGNMTCCGRSCTAQCHQCQVLNVARAPREPAEGDEEEVQESPHVLRTMHVGHPCQRSLFCGHICGKDCSVDHECRITCKEACRQVCAHARCKNYCSVPCAPCQEPCTWRCAHHSCPLPCGTICARLPCDRRCERSLACGHRCPSVCGEDCAIQVCRICAPEELRHDVVDLIMQRTLDDLDTESDSLDELIITIPNCRHSFTVETLDGHCGLDEYYRRSADGKWLGLEAPPPGFKQPPACPTCRGAITAPRYGRAFKRADLDILENNVASHMSKSLRIIHSKLDSLQKPNLEEVVKEAAIGISPSPVNLSNKEVKARQRTQAGLLQTKRLIPFTLQDIDPFNTKLYGLSLEEVKAWKKVLLPLFTGYKDALAVSQTRSAHSHAWESSFTYLFQKEMEDIVANPVRAPRNPQEYCMRAAKMKVGQPPPMADKRFLVESFWVTINIRLTLADLAGVWQDTAAETRKYKYPAGNRRMWAMYKSFLLRSCAVDAQLALQLTQQSESHRQEANTTLLIMRVELEQFRFNVEMTKQNVARTPKDLSKPADNTKERQNVARMTSEVRSKLADSAKDKQTAAQELVDSMRARGSRRGGARVGEPDWLLTDFVQPAQKLLDDWKALERSLRLDTFYQPVSHEELTQIVKGFNFSHTGHFYKCPNGHIFVITECGGATERSFCRECGEPIGGTGHSLLSTNTHATELEEIARRQGSQRSPWAWGV